jgi:hypothetical protein
LLFINNKFYALLISFIIDNNYLGYCSIVISPFAGRGKIYICLIPNKGIEIIQPRKDKTNTSMERQNKLYNKFSSKTNDWEKRYGIAASFDVVDGDSLQISVNIFNAMKLHYPGDTLKDANVNLSEFWLQCFGIERTKPNEFVGRVRNPIYDQKQKHRSAYILNLDTYAQMGTEEDLINLV